MLVLQATAMPRIFAAKVRVPKTTKLLSGFIRLDGSRLMAPPWLHFVGNRAVLAGVKSYQSCMKWFVRTPPLSWYGDCGSSRTSWW